jgi:hypothetical protein
MSVYAHAVLIRISPAPVQSPTKTEDESGRGPALIFGLLHMCGGSLIEILLTSIT